MARPDREAYAREGIFWPLTLFEQEDSETLLPQYRAFQDRAQEIYGREIIINPHLLSPWLYAIARHPVVLDAVEMALGPDILLWYSEFFIKPAHSGSYVSWHQDWPYWGLTTHEAVTVWLAFTPSTKQSGAMEVIPGTHGQGVLGPLNEKGDLYDAYRAGHKRSAEGDLLTFSQDLSGRIDPESALAVELRPGEFSLHHVDLVHGGQPNQADFDRVGFVLRYITPCTANTSPGDSALLVRGEDAHRHFIAERAPLDAFGDAERALYAEVSRRPSGFGKVA